VLKVIHFDSAPPDVQKDLRASRANEWNKLVQFAAAIPITGREKYNLLAEGHTVVSSKWVNTDKAEHKKGSPDYVPVWKSRRVSCGNFDNHRRISQRFAYGGHRPFRLGLWIEFCSWLSPGAGWKALTPKHCFLSAFPYMA